MKNLVNQLNETEFIISEYEASTRLELKQGYTFSASKVLDRAKVLFTSEIQVIIHSDHVELLTENVKICVYSSLFIVSLQ